MIVLTALHLSSTWVISRLIAPRDAWTPDLFDGFMGIVFLSSWVVNTIQAISGVTNGDLQGDPPVVLVTVIAYVCLYVGTIAAFAKVRTWVGD